MQGQFSKDLERAQQASFYKFNSKPWELKPQIHLTTASEKVAHL